jgi:CDP-diacylglycerol--glycerol-3-phosphate 3-phosphatidyltransferase
MLAKYVRPLLSLPVSWLVQRLRSAGVTPNMVTYTGFALTVLSAFILAGGRLILGGFVLWAASMLDMIDGSLARQTGQSTSFGAFIDSTLDRYSEIIALGGLVWHFSNQTDSSLVLFLLYVTMAGSLMVSYTRARAEGLHLDVKEGWLQRPERLTILIAGLIFGLVQPALWILAIFTNVTALQRIHQVYWRLRHDALDTSNTVKTSIANHPINGTTTTSNREAV